MEDKLSFSKWPKTCKQIEEQFSKRKISLLFKNKQLWFSLIFGTLINVVYLYLFNFSFKATDREWAVGLCMAAIIMIVVLLSWLPNWVVDIGISFSIFYIENIVFSIWYLIWYLILYHLVKSEYLGISVAIFTAFTTLITIVLLVIIYFEYLEKSVFAAILSIGSSIIVFSLPVIFIVVRSQALAIAIGSFIAFITHFFFKKIIPYMYSSRDAEIKNLSKIELVYELNSTGKILVGLIDMLFAYIVLAYSIAMNFATQQLVDIKIKTNGKNYKDALVAAQQLYGRHIKISISSGTIYYWSQRANDVFKNTFTTVFLIELFVSTFVFWGLYRNLNNMSVFKRIIKEKGHMDNSNAKDR